MGTRVSRIRFDNVSKIFPRGNGSITALEDVSFEVADQEFVTIVGPSGCGKTTLMRMVAGLEMPTVGISRLEGMEAHARTSDIRLAKWFSGENFDLSAAE
jgi:ABC-type sugar transport system ATPase subunit